MRLRLYGAFFGLALAAGLAAPAAAQNKPSVAIMPAQFFSADEQSAKALTDALTQHYKGQGYNVMAAEDAAQAFQGMNLEESRHYPDRVALRFGRRMNSDLVIYPRLLALGLPVNTQAEGSALMRPAAVVHMRVLNVNSGGMIYFTQIGHEFLQTPPMRMETFSLAAPNATEAVRKATAGYFQRIEGSRQETRRTGGRGRRR